MFRVSDRMETGPNWTDKRGKGDSHVPFMERIFYVYDELKRKRTSREEVLQVREGPREDKL